MYIIVVCFQPFVSSEMLVHTQASGHRRVLVKPVNLCTKKCKFHLVEQYYAYFVCFQPFVSSEMLLYTQASGHRRVLVKPVNQCTEKCTSQLVIMEPGDSCKYQGDHVS